MDQNLDAASVDSAQQLERLLKRARGMEAERVRLKQRLTSALESPRSRAAAPPFPLGFLAGLVVGALFMFVMRILSGGVAP